MAYQSVASWKTYLGTVAQSGYAASDLAGFQLAAMQQAVDAAWYRIQDVLFQDLVPNGTLTRWALAGENVNLLPTEDQLAPGGLTGYGTFTGVSWVYDAMDIIAVEQQVKADGTAVVAGTDSPVCTIAVTTAPPASYGKVRVWYARRVPTPSVDADIVRLPVQYARTAITGYYYEQLALNAPGGDTHAWAQHATAWIAAAQKLYAQAVPPIPLLALRRTGVH